MGQEQIMEDLYKQYYKYVFNVCLRMVKQPDIAEDLAQQVFIRIIEHLDQFKHRSVVRTWIHRIAVNEALMYFRKKSTKSEIATSPEDLSEAFGQPTENFMNLIDRMAIRQLVENLPTGYRTVLMLHDVEGYDHREIGRMLNLHEGSSKSQTWKGRRSLRKALAA